MIGRRSNRSDKGLKVAMVKCKKCFKEYDDKTAAGVCPYCGYCDGDLQDDPRNLPIGHMLHERYIVGGVLGVGGFGITYKVWDTRYNVCKAIKEYFQQGVVNRIPGDTKVFVSAPKRREEFEYGKERLLNEARIVAKFQSTSIVRVDDFFEENGTSYMVMEFLDMQTLEEYISERKKPLTADEAITVGVNICEALEEIHSAGVIHRDISLDNIFVTEDGKVNIIDFGSARLCKEDIDSRMIVLKPGYAPPEQYEKIDPDNDMQQAWTDIYALGATLYTCVTGQVPAESSDRKADYDAGTDRVCYPNEINHNIPDYLSNSIMTAMAINIHERFQNATEMKEALLQKRKVEPVEVVRKKKKRKRTAGIAAGIAVAGILLSIFAGSLSKNKEEVVLNEASISVWYSVSSNEEEAAEKESVMKSIEEDMYNGDQFMNVEVEFRAIPEGDYEAELQQAYENGEMPTVFESSNADAEYMETAITADNIVRRVAKNSCYLIDENKDYFKNSKLMPTAMNVPVIYINTYSVKDCSDITEISDIEELMSLCDGQLKHKRMAIRDGMQETYSDILSGFDDYASKMNVSSTEFASNKAVVYFSDTSDYFTIKEALPSYFTMISVTGKNIPCTFANFWSVSEGTEAEVAAASAFVAYLLSNNVQIQYYWQANNPGLPLEKGAFDNYADVRWQFESIVDGKNTYIYR